MSAPPDIEPIGKPSPWSGCGFQPQIRLAARRRRRGAFEPGERPLDAPRRFLSGRGFTLLEVLMALVIFSMAAVVLGSAYVNVLVGYDVAARGMVVDDDVAFARQLLLNESDREKVENGGEFDTADGRRAKWSAEITSTNLADVFNVAFTCEIPDPNRPEPVRVTESFVLLRPTWSTDPGERGKLKEQTKTKILELQSKLPSAAGVTR